MRFAEQIPSLTGWIADATDPQRLTEAARSADPTLAERLVSCEPKKLRLVSEDGMCRGVYALTLRSDDGSLEVVAVEGTVRPPGAGSTGTGHSGVFGSAGWSARLDQLGIELATLHAEVGLVWYDDLLDPAKAPDVLTAVLRTGPRGAEGLVVRRASSKVMRYKRGSRCTFRHEVSVEHDDAAVGAGAAPFPDTVISKTYSGNKGEVADRSMRGLWNSSFRYSAVVSIAEPLGYDPDRRILLQGPVPESQTLKAALVAWFAGDDPDGWPRLITTVGRVGVGLAEMHSSGVACGEPVGIAEEIAEIRDRAARVRAAFPANSALLDAIEHAVAAIDQVEEQEPYVGVHRSFRPAQVLLSGEVLSFIDFDGYCQAEPAMDIAMFTSMLRAIALNKGLEDKASLATMNDATRVHRLDEGEALCAAFLDGYRSTRAVSTNRLLAWETAHVGSLVVSSWTKLKLSRLPNTLYLFDDQINRNTSALTGP